MIALVAGEGALPGAVYAALQAQGAAVSVHALAGHPPQGLEAKPFRIEHLGSFIQTQRDQGATQVCFAGAVARPKIDPAAIDPRTMPYVPRMMQAMTAGDDAALRIVLTFFEEAGITPVAAHDLVPALLPETGVLVGAMTEADTRDLARARAVHKGLAALDIGQGVVVAGGQVLAVEALPGTDWMLRSLAKPSTAPQPQPDPGDPFEMVFGGVSDWLGGQGAPKPQAAQPAKGDFARPEGGVFYKAPKAGQDRRIDLPVIGPATVTLAAKAGLRGIAIEASGVMVLDRDGAEAAAREAGLFLAVVEPEA